jgi:rare lipoprotein A
VIAQRAGLSVALTEAGTAARTARTALGHDVRTAYEQATAPPVLAVPDAGAEDARYLLVRAQRAQLADRGAALAGVQQADARLVAARVKVDAATTQAVAQAAAVEVAQEHARSLLATATTAYAADQAQLARIRAAQALLDQQSRAVATKLAPVVAPDLPEGQRRQAIGEEPVIEALEATPDGQLPAGYHLTGQQLTGLASWYGPGFTGHPTATGRIYDPERLTAAMLALPLGTVVRVTGPDGRSVNVLVDDRGPYVDGRIIDLSHRAAQAIGVGVTTVTVQVLARD